MRAVVAEWFQHSSLMGWPLLALALFILVFAIAMLRLARRDASSFDDLARLPLEEDRHD